VDLKEIGDREDHPEITFFVNDEPLVVHAESLTVHEILDIAGISWSDHVLVETRDGHKIIFGKPEEAVALRTELRLFARPREYQIVVNGRERDVDHDELTYAQVVALAPNMPPPGEGVELLVTYIHAAHDAKGDLIPGESVRIKDGTQFSVAPGNRS
jgi:hypothetical protein